MKILSIWCICVISVISVICGFASSELEAQVLGVPQLINYQGRVVSGSTNFNGTGQFKFAVVTTVSIPFPHTVTLWSNDGTSSNGSEPTNAVSLTVSNGLYSVLLGDTTLTNMTAVPASVFNNANVLLRVWFNDGTKGSQQLTPDQRVAAVGYAMMAANVPDGSITGSKIGSGAITSANIANGAIGASQLGAGAAASNLGSTGAVILSAIDNNSALISAGYVRIGATQVGDIWQPRTSSGAPSARGAPAVWTGSEMIVWGGSFYNGSSTVYLNDGGRYNPASNSWTAIPNSLANTPSTRGGHSAVWTGSEMIVWGGTSSSAYLNDGGRYNPASNSWTAIPNSLANTPSARATLAVWTGSEMIVWGGQFYNGTSTVYLNDGGRYNPASNSWTAIPNSLANTPSARTGHTPVWAGSEMIVWGGYNATSSFNDGGRYNPSSNSWTAIPSSLVNTPSVRGLYAGVWTGSQMIVWGGSTSSAFLNDGGSYDPAANSWTAIPSALTNTPSARNFLTPVWTGSEMIVWGGRGQGGDRNDGGVYDPASGTWAAISNSSANTPSARESNTAVWTGNEMIVWGGANNFTYFNDTFSYSPPRTMILYQKP